MPPEKLAFPCWLMLKLKGSNCCTCVALFYTQESLNQYLKEKLITIPTVEAVLLCWIPLNGIPQIYVLDERG